MSAASASLSAQSSQPSDRASSKFERRDIQPDHAAAMCLEQLDRDQPYESEADHGDALAEPHVGLADTLERDGAERD